jgi:hypothetical protein
MKATYQRGVVKIPAIMSIERLPSATIRLMNNGYIGEPIEQADQRARSLLLVEQNDESLH